MEIRQALAWISIFFWASSGCFCQCSPKYFIWYFWRFRQKDRNHELFHIKRFNTLGFCLTLMKIFCLFIKIIPDESELFDRYESLCLVIISRIHVHLSLYKETFLLCDSAVVCSLLSVKHKRSVVKPFLHAMLPSLVLVLTSSEECSWTAQWKKQYNLTRC